METNMDNESFSGGGGIQALVTAPIAIPIILVALILILVAASRLSAGEWMSGFTLFLVGGIMAYFGKMMMD
jgi:ABC-type sulfate transport system permease component